MKFFTSRQADKTKTQSKEVRTIVFYHSQMDGILKLLPKETSISPLLLEHSDIDEEASSNYKKAIDDFARIANPNPHSIFRVIILTHGSKDGRILFGIPIHPTKVIKELQKKISGQLIVDIFACHIGFGLQPQIPPKKTSSTKNQKIYKTAINNGTIAILHSNKNESIILGDLYCASLICQTSGSLFESVISQILIPFTFKVLIKDSKEKLAIHKCKRMPIDEDITALKCRDYLAERMDEWTEFYRTHNLERFEVEEVDVRKILKEYKDKIGCKKDLTLEETREANDLIIRYFNIDFAKSKAISHTKNDRRASIYFDLRQKLNLYIYGLPGDLIGVFYKKLFEMYKLEYFAERSEDESNQIFKICLNGNSELLKEVLNNTKKEDVKKLCENKNIYGEDCLDIALKKGHLHIVEILLSTKFEWDLNNYIKRILALDINKICYLGLEKIFQIFVDNNMLDKNKKDAQAIVANACIGGSNYIVEKLINLGFNFNFRIEGTFSTPLIECCKSTNIITNYDERLKIVKKLIKCELDIDSQDIEGSTALIYICKLPHHEKLKMVKEIIDAGANVNIANKNGETALGEILRNGNKDQLKNHNMMPIIILLLQNKANCNLVFQEKNKKGVMRDISILTKILLLLPNALSSDIDLCAGIIIKSEDFRQTASEFTKEAKEFGIETKTIDRLVTLFTPDNAPSNPKYSRSRTRILENQQSKT